MASLRGVLQKDNVGVSTTLELPVEVETEAIAVLDACDRVHDVEPRHEVYIAGDCVGRPQLVPFEVT